MLAVITNGEIDLLYQAEWSPKMTYNNAHGFQAISEDAYEAALNNFTKPGGCRDLIEQCRTLGDLSDPEEVGLNETVNQVCVSASIYCFTNVFGAYSVSSRSHFDMAISLPSSSPPVSGMYTRKMSMTNMSLQAYTTGWANRAWVQQALGARVNFTENSYLTQSLFYGGIYRRAGLKDVEYLLSRGIKVALIYGDRPMDQC